MWMLTGLQLHFLLFDILMKLTRTLSNQLW